MRVDSGLPRGSWEIEVIYSCDSDVERGMD